MNLEAIKRELANIARVCGDEDQQLLSDMIEGETDAHRIISRLLAAAEESETLSDALAVQIAERQERKNRLKDRCAAIRGHVMALMQIAGIKKLELPEATLSVRNRAPKPVVTDPDAVPDKYCTFTRKPSLFEITADFDGGNIPGVQFDNGGASLTVRRK